MRMTMSPLFGVAFAGLLAWFVAADDPKADPPKADGDPVVVVDAAGKEHKLKTWKFTAGTRHLNWLATPDKEPEPKDKPKDKEEPKDKERPNRQPPPRAKAPTGPEAIEFRELDSTNFAEGILTLVPVERARLLEYDAAKKTVKLTVATGPKADAVATLNGSTEYKSTNRVSIDAEIDKGDLGLAAVKFLGGDPKGVKSIKFPETNKDLKVLAGGRTAQLKSVADSKGSTTHRIGDFKPLYRFGDGTEVLSSTLYFKTTLKVDIAKITKIAKAEGMGADIIWHVTIGKDEDTLTLLKNPMIDGKQVLLTGFVGRVQAGYKFFPLHVIGEVEFDISD
jgi:hypothetical protein